MKATITLVLIMLGMAVGTAQENDIETKSVKIDDLISFVVQNYDAADQIDRNITFLVQVKEDQFGGEDLILLRQAFKLISERLSENSKLSLVTYSKFGGLALGPTLAKEEKLILHTLTDLKGNIAEFYQDGIALGYQHANQNFDDSFENTVVIIRNTSKAQNEVVDIAKADKKAKRKQKTNAILIATLSLLPELIEVIKD